MKDLKDKIVIVGILAFVISVLFLTRTITSGYHFVDDHEVIKIKSELKVSSLNSVVKDWLMTDMKDNQRFRPFYYIHRVYETKLFGSDFFLWSLYNGFLWCMALILFYAGIRNLNFPLEESVIFLVIIFIGPQSSVWWRLGPGESLGMVLLGLSFYFMTKAMESKSGYLYNLLFIFFLILSSLTKESFLLIIPAFLIFKVWNERVWLWSSLRESMFKNLILIIPSIAFVVEMLIIKKYVGIGYTGLESNMMSNVPRITGTILRFLSTYMNLLIVGIVLAFICIRNKKMPVKFNVLPFLFFLLIIAPNIVLYATSGLVKRYLLPSTLGLAFFIISVIHSIDKTENRFRNIARILILISFLPFIVDTYAEAVKFEKEGKSTGNLLSAISKNYVQGSQVMVIVDPVLYYEKSISLKTYLSYEDHIELYGYGLSGSENNSDYQGAFDSWKSYFEGRQFENMTSKPELLIFLDNKMIEEFFSKSDLQRNRYVLVDLGKSPFALLKEDI